MPKPSSIFQDIKNRYITVRQKYKSMENLYRQRVGDIASMDLERELPVERFCLKANFGWEPLKNVYIGTVSKEKFDLDDERAYKAIATAWFDDLNFVKYKIETEDPDLITGKSLKLQGKSIYQVQQKQKRLEAALQALVKDRQRNETELEQVQVIARWNQTCIAISYGVPIVEACRGETYMSWLSNRAAKKTADGKKNDEKTSDKKSKPTPDQFDDVSSKNEEDSNDEEDLNDGEDSDDEEENVKTASAKQEASWETAVKDGECYDVAVRFELPVWDCPPIPSFDWTMLGWGARQKLIEVKEIHTNSFAIAASDANTALLDEYIAAWKALAPHEATYPYPVRGLTKEAIRQFSRITLSRASLSHLWPDQKIKLMVKSFLMAGKGIAATITEDHAKIEVKLARSNTDAQMSAFKKFLKHKELPRWHSDWINKRTGDPESEQPDESIGTREEVKLVRTAIDEMVEMCETWRQKMHRF